MFLFFFNDTATTEIYTLSLHDALPISLNISFCMLDVARNSFPLLLYAWGYTNPVGGVAVVSTAFHRILSCPSEEDVGVNSNAL